MQARIRTFAIAAACLSAVVLASPASAQWYAGGNAGRSQVQYNGGQLATDLSIHGITGTGSIDNSDLGFKLFGGYRLNDTFAVEAGYVNLGKFSLNGSYTRPLPAGTFTGDLKSHGLNVDLVGSVGMGDQLSAYGRFGAAYLNTKASASASTASFVGYSNATKDQIVADLGIGFQMDFTKGFAARLEWQHFFQVGDSTTGRTDIDLFTLGLIRKF
jgi:OOP family OmpA-OmpF porin